MLREGFEQFNNIPEKKPAPTRTEPPALSGIEGPERMLSSDEREALIDELKQVEERMKILRGTIGYARHKEDGIPLEKLHEGERKQMEELRDLGRRAKKIRDAVGFLLDEE